MKFFYILPLLFYTSSVLLAQKDNIRFTQPNSSVYELTKDSSDINYYTLNQVHTGLGAKFYRGDTVAVRFKGSRGIMGAYFFEYKRGAFISHKQQRLVYKTRAYELDSNEKIYYYGFTSQLNDGNKVNRNFSRFLISAYKQVIDTPYAQNSANFTSLRIIDKAEFWKRNMINMGYGMSYLAKENPFMGGKGFSIGFGYALEALHYFPIFAGPFIGETKEDKILIPVIGLSSLIFWKGIFGLVGNSNIRLNRDIRKTGFHLPEGLEY